MELKDDSEDSGWSRKSLETRDQEDEIEERQAKAFLHGDQSKSWLVWRSFRDKEQRIQ